MAVTSIALLFPVLLGGASGQAVTRAYCSKDQRVRVTYQNGTVKTVSPKHEQVRCEAIEVAADRRTVGWPVLVENCCTSYPIPMSLVVFRDGKRTIISSDQMIWKWHFIGKGESAAVLSGPVHAANAAAANLYETHRGQGVAYWDGNGTAPEWAHGWERDFHVFDHLRVQPAPAKDRLRAALPEHEIIASCDGAIFSNPSVRIALARSLTTNQFELIVIDSGMQARVLKTIPAHKLAPELKCFSTQQLQALKQALVESETIIDFLKPLGTGAVCISTAETEFECWSLTKDGQIVSIGGWQT